MSPRSDFKISIKKKGGGVIDFPKKKNVLVWGAQAFIIYLMYLTIEYYI